MAGAELFDDTSDTQTRPYKGTGKMDPAQYGAMLKRRGLPVNAENLNRVSLMQARGQYAPEDEAQVRAETTAQKPNDVGASSKRGSGNARPLPTPPKPPSAQPFKAPGGDPASTAQPAPAPAASPPQGTRVNTGLQATGDPNDNGLLSMILGSLGAAGLTGLAYAGGRGGRGGDVPGMEGEILPPGSPGGSSVSGLLEAPTSEGRATGPGIAAPQQAPGGIVYKQAPALPPPQQALPAPAGTSPADMAAAINPNQSGVSPQVWEDWDARTGGGRFSSAPGQVVDTSTRRPSWISNIDANRVNGAGDARRVWQALLPLLTGGARR